MLSTLLLLSGMLPVKSGVKSDKIHLAAVNTLSTFHIRDQSNGITLSALQELLKSSG